MKSSCIFISKFKIKYVCYKNLLKIFPKYGQYKNLIILQKILFLYWFKEKYFQNFCLNLNWLLSKKNFWNFNFDLKKKISKFFLKKFNQIQCEIYYSDFNF